MQEEVELIILFLFILRNKRQEEELDSKMNALAPYCVDEDSAAGGGRETEWIFN